MAASSSSRSSRTRSSVADSMPNALLFSRRFTAINASNFEFKASLSRFWTFAMMKTMRKVTTELVVFM
jgi:hypothetical protein